MTYGPRLLNTVQFVYSNKKETRITFELILCCLLIKIKTIHSANMKTKRRINCHYVVMINTELTAMSDVICHVRSLKLESCKLELDIAITIPHADDILSKLGNSKVFSVIDLKNAYY